MFKQFLLAAALIAVPAAGFSVVEIMLHKSAQAAATLGDLSAMKAIVVDVQGIASTGDFKAAEARITDFETAWDDAEAVMRPLNKEAWSMVDEAADAALHALRKKAPDGETVKTTLAGLITALDNPAPQAGESKGVKMVAGIAVTDETGHPLACETMIKPFQAALDGGTIKQDNLATANDLMAKALERCNADDDANADSLSAQGLALAVK